MTRQTVGDESRNGGLNVVGALTAGSISNPTFTGVASFPDGSASAPSITNTGDTNTGIAFPAADVVAISTGGTERVRVDSSGRVGMGTTSPSKPLHVVADAAAGYEAALFAGSVADSWTLVRMQDSTTNTADFGVVSGGGATIRVGSTERLRVDSNGLITGTGTSLGAWTSYTPTVTAVTGTFTTVSATGRYCQIGKIVVVSVVVNITTNGTAATEVIVTLPFQAANNGVQYIGTGRESTTTGKTFAARVLASGTAANLSNYDNTYPGGNGYALNFTLTYERA